MADADKIRRNEKFFGRKLTTEEENELKDSFRTCRPQKHTPTCLKKYLVRVREFTKKAMRECAKCKRAWRFMCTDCRARVPTRFSACPIGNQNLIQLGSSPDLRGPVFYKRSEENSSTLQNRSRVWDEQEIETVMYQASCSREVAIVALQKHQNMVDAILELTP